MNKNLGRIPGKSKKKCLSKKEMKSKKVI